MKTAAIIAERQQTLAKPFPDTGLCHGAVHLPVVHAAPEVIPPIVHGVLRSPGQPLDPAARALMEPRFGQDFSRVRVHTDDRAAQSAQAVGALAYTLGQEIVFGSGRYRPDTPAGRRLLAHELAHVTQQSPEAGRSGPVRIGPAGCPLERQADRAAQAVGQPGPASGLDAGTGPCSLSPGGQAAAGTLQREAAPRSLLSPCDARNTSVLRSAAAFALGLARDAVRGLQELIGIWGRAPATASQSATSLALARGFNIAFDKTTWVSVLGMDEAEVRTQDARDQAATRTILANFQQIEADLPHYASPPACTSQMTSGSPCFGCVAAEHHRCRRGALAFVPPPFIGQPSSAMLFCPGFFALGPEEAGETLLHESAHLQPFGAHDKIGEVRYYGCPVAPIDEGPGLQDPREFIGIADAYRCFVTTQRQSTAAFERIERISRAARRSVEEAVEPPAGRERP